LERDRIAKQLGSWNSDVDVDYDSCDDISVDDPVWLYQMANGDGSMQL
jgi:hypothetical protein